MSENSRYLSLMVVISIIYTGILTYCQCIRGISYWDIFVYLQNAMLFSNHNIGSQLGVPPVMSLLTAVPFSLGFISETSLFVVSAILFVFLIIGVYLLFCESFDREVSLISTLIFSMFSLIVTWAISGATDVPALCFAVWSLLFTVYALKRDFKYSYPAFLFFILAFFTRFTEGFILLVIAYYVFINFDEFRKELTGRRLVTFICFALAVMLVIFGAYFVVTGSVPFISQFLEVSSSSQVSTVNVGYELNPWYYVQNLPEYLASFGVSDSYFSTLSTSSNSPAFLSYVLLALTAVFIGFFALKFTAFDKSDVDRWSYKVFAVIVLSLFSIISYTHVSYMITEILFMIILLLYYKWFPDNDNKMDYVMILWMGIYIIMHSYHPVKVDRYIIPIFIPLTYSITQALKYTLKNKKKIVIALVIILVLMIPINASYLSSVTKENPHTHEEMEAARYLSEYDPNFVNYNISSDRGVVFTWYFKKYVYTTIPRVLEATNESLNDKLDSINARYYIDSTSNTTNITGYKCIYDNNKEIRLKIYERI